MKKSLVFLFVFMALSIFFLGCAPAPEVSTEPEAAVEEVRVIDPQDFTLVGFWKIEQKFLLDEEKSTENNLQWIEIPVPKEKYKEFREWCGDKDNKQALFGELGIPVGQMQDYGEGQSGTMYPPVSIIPSPALPSGNIPLGVCYFHKVDFIPSEGKLSTLVEMSMQGVTFTENGTIFLVQELQQTYNFTQRGLELITGYFEKEGDTQQKLMRTILIPSTQAAAEANGWPYNITID
ncbi:MAG TPA: hypothetical protein VJI32_03290 [Candidatus Nanoarchaeia archaeon]|nr:hypothetical protein [Candidatus Nanoarchaeia archaeon]